MIRVFTRSSILVAALLTGLSLHFTTFAQQVGFQWARRVGSNSNEIGRGIFRLPSGNLLYTGNHNSGLMSLDTGIIVPSPVNPSGLVLQMQASTGFVNWSYLAQSGVNVGPAELITAAGTPSGRIYVGGYRSDASDEQMHLAALNAQGQVAWTRESTGGFGASNFASINSIAVGQAERVYAAGTSNGNKTIGTTVNSPNNAGFVVCYDSAGTHQWTAAFLGTNVASGTQARTIHVLSNGNLLVCGLYAGNVDFDPGPGSVIRSSSANDIFVLELTSNGAFVMVFVLGGTGVKDLTSTALTSNGNLIMGGFFNGTVDFNPSPTATETIVSNQTDGFVARYSVDTALGLVYAKSFTGPLYQQISSVSIDAAGSVIAGGYYEANFDVDPGAGVVTLVNQGSFDGFVVKLSQSGDYIGSARFGGTGQDRCQSVLAGPGDLLYLAGTFQGTVDFDPTSATQNIPAINGFDGFFALWSVGCSPLISQQPQPAGRCLGGNATFTVSASGADTIRWRFNGNPISNGSKYSGVNTATLSVSNITAADTGLYSCVISNACGTTTSNGARLALGAQLSIENGLVAYFPMNGTSMNQVSNTLPLQQGAATNFSFVEDRFGNPRNALRKVPATYFRQSIPNLPTGNSRWTMAAWVRPAASSGSNGIMGYGNNTAGQANRLLINFNNIRHLNFGNDLNGPVLALNVWTHVAVTYNGTERILYINGIPSVTQATSPLNVQNTQFFIGASDDNTTQSFNGDLDDIMLYNRTLSVDEINLIKEIPSFNFASQQNPPSCLGSYVRMEATLINGSNYQWLRLLPTFSTISGANDSTFVINNYQLADLGTYAATASDGCYSVRSRIFETSTSFNFNTFGQLTSRMLLNGNTNAETFAQLATDGVLTTPTGALPSPTSATNRFGQPGRALQLSGNQFVSVNSNLLSTSWATGRTLVIWFKTTQVLQGILGLQNAAPPAVPFNYSSAYIDSAGFLRAFLPSGGGRSSYRVNDNRWHCLVLHYPPGTSPTQKIFVDGELISSVTFASPGSFSNYTLGACYTAGRPAAPNSWLYMDGVLDDFRIMEGSFSDDILSGLTYQPEPAPFEITGNRCLFTNDTVRLIASPGTYNNVLQMSWVFNNSQNLNNASTTHLLPNFGANGPSGQYHYEVVSGCFRDRSAIQSASVSVIGVPNFLQVPAPVTTRCEGSSFTFQSAATSPLPVSYRWFKNNIQLPGDTLPTLPFVSLALGDSGLYRVSAQNACGTNNAQDARLNVNPKPVTPTISANGNVLTANLSGGPAVSSYNWLLNNASQGTGTSSFTATQSGTYRVIAITAQSCASDTSAGLPFTVTGLALEKPLAGLELYPNPAQDHVLLSMTESGLGNLKLQLHDANGRLVLSRDWLPAMEAQLLLSLRELRSGMYMLTVSSGDKLSRYKLMIGQ